MIWNILRDIVDIVVDDEPTVALGVVGRDDSRGECE
jgi:hypothetical protein